MISPFLLFLQTFLTLPDIDPHSFRGSSAWIHLKNENFNCCNTCNVIIFLVHLVTGFLLIKTGVTRLHANLSIR